MPYKANKKGPEQLERKLMSVLFTKPSVQKPVIHHFPNIRSNKKVVFVLLTKLEHSLQ